MIKSNLQLDPEKVFAEYGESLYRFCNRLTGNTADAEDLAQEVFLAAFRGNRQFRGDSSVQTWLFQIAVFKSRRRFRKFLNLQALWTASAPTPRDHDTHLELDQAIRSLPTKLREAFILVKVEQFTCAEASQILDIPEGTVKYHVFEAIQKLRQALDPVTTTPAAQLSNKATHEL